MQIFKRKGLSRMKRPPQVNCSKCGRMFKSRRALNKHVLDKKPCKPIESTLGRGKTMTLSQIEEFDHELTQMKTHNYIGRQYNFNPIPTGNRHYRTGITLPRLSSYRSQAI
jgi:hypothetical protein